MEPYIIYKKEDWHLLLYRFGDEMTPRVTRDLHCSALQVVGMMQQVATLGPSVHCRQQRHHKSLV